MFLWCPCCTLFRARAQRYQTQWVQGRVLLCPYELQLVKNTELLHDCYYDFDRALGTNRYHRRNRDDNNQSQWRSMHRRRTHADGFDRSVRKMSLVMFSPVDPRIPFDAN